MPCHGALLQNDRVMAFNGLAIVRGRTEQQKENVSRQEQRRLFAVAAVPTKSTIIYSPELHCWQDGRTDAGSSGDVTRRRTISFVEMHVRSPGKGWYNYSLFRQQLYPSFGQDQTSLVLVL